MICAKNAAADSVAATCGSAGTRMITTMIIITRMAMAIITPTGILMGPRLRRSSWT